MKIDIISYTDAQFALLSDEQLLEIKSAQMKKNKLDADLEIALLKEKKRLIDNGIFFSNMWEMQAQKLREKHALEVENLRESLLFYLRFSSKSDEVAEAGLPYKTNYSLTMDERFYQVRDAYMNSYSDAKERFDKFKDDGVAPAYLGEYYAPLYDYIGSFI